MVTDGTARAGGGGTRWIPWVLVGVTLLGMGRLCGMDFTWWDDDKTVHHNPRLNPPSVAGVGYYWAHPHMSLYAPVTYTVWSGLAAIARVETPDARGIELNPWVFHTANVAVHVGSVLVVYQILRRVVRHKWAAAVGAAVFAVHPVQVEAVGWVSGMKDLLCGLFVMLAVWQYLIHAEGRGYDGAGEGPGSGGGRRAWGAYAVGTACFVLGMLSKPTAVVTPVIVAALDRWVCGRGWRQVARSAGLWVLLAVPCLVWTKMVQDSSPKGPMWSRPLVALDALAFYLGKLAWPAELAVDYGRNPTYVIEAGQLYWTWVAPVAVGIVLWAGRRRWPVLVAAGLVFVAGVGPVLGLTPFRFQAYSTVADHYLYVSMLGVALAVAWAAARWWGRGMAVAAAVVVAALAVRSFVQTEAWADEFTLNRNTIAVNPRSHLGHYNLGIALEYRAREEQSEAVRDEAIAQLRKAIEAKPDHVRARSSLATLLMRRGETDEALRLLREAVEHGERLPPESRGEAAPAHFALGLHLTKEGRHAEAVEAYRKALELQPGSGPIRAALEKAERESGTRPVAP